MAKKKKEEWKYFSPETYQNECAELAHFSAKAVNSNASPLGVRLSKADSVDLPYLSVSTCAPESIAVDYLANGGQRATVFKQARLASQGIDVVRDRYPDVSQDEINEIAAIYQDAMSKSKDLTRDKTMDCRLKQVIEVDEAGNDICLSPLHSTGFLLAINAHEKTLIDRLNTEKKENKTVYRIMGRAKMHYGGANPQNAGGLIRDMNFKGPLFFQGPQESISIKKAYAIYYKGIKFLPVKLVDDYLLWNDTKQSKKKNKADREQEKALIRRIVNAILKKGEDAGHYLNDYSELFDGALISPDLSPLQKGLILTSERDVEWRKNFSIVLARLITERKRLQFINGKSVDLRTGITDQERLYIEGIIKKEVFL